MQVACRVCSNIQLLRYVCRFVSGNHRCILLGPAGSLRLVRGSLLKLSLVACICRCLLHTVLYYVPMVCARFVRLSPCYARYVACSRAYVCPGIMPIPCMIMRMQHSPIYLPRVRVQSLSLTYLPAAHCPDHRGPTGLSRARMTTSRLPPTATWATARRSPAATPPVAP